MVVVRCKGSSGIRPGRESGRVAQHDSHKNVNANRDRRRRETRLVNRMTHQQRNNMLARATGERRTILVESLILAQDQRWRRA